MTASPMPAAVPSSATGIWGVYQRTPLYVRIVIGLILGVGLGFVMGEKAAELKPFSSIVLRLLSALATPLIFCAVVHALATAKASGRMGLRLFGILMVNTVVAILIGLFVANLMEPGRHGNINPAEELKSHHNEAEDLAKKKPFHIVDHILSKIPGSMLKPLVENDIMSVILIALAMGIVLRQVKHEQIAAGKTAYKKVEDFLETIFACVMHLLHGLFHLVPFAVMAVVADLVGKGQFDRFKALGWFVVSVLLALLLQAIYYLIRLRLGSWVRPWDFLRGSSDALLTAFSTASSAATLPVTYDCMRNKIGASEEATGMGVMVGGTFNHDGTALYEAMAALFISQLLGNPLDFSSQLIVVVMAVFASVGAAGIPEAGLVTMIAVFTAVGLPPEYIPLLLTVDWFLDRCRTAINVMGDMCSTCLLDGKIKPVVVVVDAVAPV